MSLVAEDQGREFLAFDEDVDQKNIGGLETQEIYALVPAEEGVVVMTLEEAMQVLAEKEA